MSSKRRATKQYALHTDASGKQWYERCGRGGPFVVKEPTPAEPPAPRDFMCVSAAWMAAAEKYALAVRP